MLIIFMKYVVSLLSLPFIMMKKVVLFSYGGMDVTLFTLFVFSIITSILISQILAHMAKEEKE